MTTSSFSERRRAGVCLHLTSLGGDYGIGELGAPAVRFLDWMSRHNLSVWQFLPIGPTGYGNSPYQLLSVFAGNPLLINLAELVDWGLLEQRDLPEPATGDAAVADYAFAIATKTAPLQQAAENLLSGIDAELLAEYEAFCQASDDTWLNDFAAFSVLKSLNNELPWTAWHRADESPRDAVARVARDHSIQWQVIKCIQFFFFRQWAALRRAARERGILLFGDVPIYLALDCAEAWAHPELLELGTDGRPTEVSGVPPDYFSADGQLWGNPIYRWDEHARTGFDWWISRMRQALAACDLVRLDHFRGFDEFWAVPADATTARDGEWRPGPRHALFEAFSGTFGSAPFVAEDLGIITESVTELRKAFLLPGMQVLQFLVDQPEFDADEIEEDCVCYTGTHDNDTSEGWFSGSNGHMTGDALQGMQNTILHNIGPIDENVHRTLIALCFSTRAKLAIVPMQDLLGLGSEARMNTPGKAEGNWLWRVTDSSLDRTDLDYINELANRTERT